MGKLHLSIISFILLITASTTSWGYMPLTVNQHLGTPDTLYSDSTADGCRVCHKPSALGIDQQPPPGMPELKSTYLPTRHHQHVAGLPGAIRDGLIAGGSEQPPLMDANGDGVIDEKYTCRNCHIVMPIDPVTGAIVENHRDCGNCHIVESKARTVHHDTPKAKEGKCGDCHGYLVRNLDEGMPPPAWKPSLLIPWASGKPNADTSIISPAGTHPGNCDYCHNASDESIEMVGAIRVFSNKETHHATGLPNIEDSSKGSPCFWCHPEDVDLPANERIRICQRCHDMESLHSIQADVAGDGVVPLMEAPFQGHIGSAVDCWGCHGFSFDASIVNTLSDEMRNPGTEATIPQLESINALVWKEGTTFEMTLSGSGFINQGGPDNGVTYRPVVQLTDSNGEVTVLTTLAESVNSAQVTIPGALPAGNYRVQIKKDDKLSNPIGVTVTPAINVIPGAVVCLSEYRVVLARGEGFARFEFGLPSSVIGITGDGADADRLFVWRDGMIAARFNAGCPSEVTVNTLFDSVTRTPVIW